MYRIVLIEDEPPILFMAKTLIESFSLPFEVVGIAFDGEDAVELLRAHQPDVVIIDIRMPVKNGLDVISELKDEYPDTEWVILSGYAEFDYAVKALQLGVSEYLLKPLDPDKMQAVLGALAGRLNNKKRMKQLDCLRSCLHEGIMPSSCGKWFSAGHYYPVLWVAGNVASNLHDLVNPGKNWFKETVLQKMEAVEPKGITDAWLLEGVAANQRVQLFAGDISPAELVQQISAILRTFQENKTVPVHVFVGSPMKSPDSLGESVQQLVEYAFQHLHIGQFEVVIASDETEKVETYPRILAFCESILQQKKFSDFRRELLLWSADWTEAGFGQAVIESILYHLAEGLKSRYDRLKMDVWDVQELIASHTELASLVNAFLDLVEKSGFDTDSGDSERKTETDQLAEMVKSYLESKYANPISYDELQAHFGYHKDYLAQLFRKKYQMSPNKYLIQIRLQNAKRLMKIHPEYSLKEIAAKVGYEDQLYFSKVFKNMEGVSPSKYREKLGVKTPGSWKR